MNLKGLNSNFLTVSVWTLGSRILGFIRDITMAALLGAGPLAEAFLIAFSLPNMFRRFFAEGALNLAFVPLFTKKLQTNKQSAHQFANDTFVVLGSILLLLTIFSQALMPERIW